VSTLNLFVILDLEAAYHTEFVGIFIICFLTIFHIPSSSGPLVIAVKLKAK
jgi:hypothetical protein